MRLWLLGRRRARKQARPGVRDPADRLARSAGTGPAARGSPGSHRRTSPLRGARRGRLGRGSLAGFRRNRDATAGRPAAVPVGAFVAGPAAAARPGRPTRGLAGAEFRLDPACRARVAARGRRTRALARAARRRVTPGRPGAGSAHRRSAGARRRPGRSRRDAGRRGGAVPAPGRSPRCRPGPPGGAGRGQPRRQRPAGPPGAGPPAARPNGRRPGRGQGRAPAVGTGPGGRPHGAGVARTPKRAAARPPAPAAPRPAARREPAVPWYEVAQGNRTAAGWRDCGSLEAGAAPGVGAARAAGRGGHAPSTGWPDLPRLIKDRLAAGPGRDPRRRRRRAGPG